MDARKERARSEGWYRFLSAVILAGVVGTFGVVLYTLATTRDLKGYEVGSLWVTAMQGAGTLGAVWAALRAVRDAAIRETQARHEAEEEAKRLRQEAERREDSIRREAREREDTLRSAADAREERLRHDAVRPVVSVDYLWSDNVLGLYVRNDGPAAALGLRFWVQWTSGVIPREFEVQAYGTETSSRPQTSSGLVLKPYQPDRVVSTTGEMNPTTGASKTINKIINETVLYYRCPVGEAFQLPTPLLPIPVTLHCRYADVLGWIWEQSAPLQTMHTEKQEIEYLPLGLATYIGDTTAGSI